MEAARGGRKKTYNSSEESELDGELLCDLVNELDRLRVDVMG